MADCMLRYGFADHWQAFIDVDEYLMVTSDASRHAVLDRLESMPPNVASIQVPQVYYGGERLADAPTVDGFDMFPRDAYTRWNPVVLEGGVRWSKAVHRTAAVETMWVHNAISLGQPGLEGAHWTTRLDDVGPNTPGVFQLLHSRRSMYKGVDFTEKYEAGRQARSQWNELATTMRQVTELYSTSLGGSTSSS